MAITTEEALGIINKYITGFQSDIADKQKLISALQVVADGLQGILDTPSQDIIAKEAKIAELTAVKAELETEKAILLEEKATLETQVAELTKPVDELSTPAVEEAVL